MKIVNVAIVGLGYWGPNLLRNFLKIPGVNVTRICDINEKNLKKISKSFPWLKTTKVFKNILNDKKIDLVAISTPLETHFSLAKQSLLANKHVFIEKPMTGTSVQGEELIKIAKNKNKLIMVGHAFVYSEAIKEIKKYFDKKELGRIYYYDSTRINLGIIQSESNVIWDLAPHDLSIINYLFPEKPLSLFAFGSSYIYKKQEELAHIIIKFENNISAHIHVSWLSPIKIRKILISGSKKMITYDDVEPSEKVKIYDKNISMPVSKITPFSPLYRSGNVTIPHLGQNETLFNELYHLISCIRNKKQPITNGEEGLKVVKLLEACDKSLKTNSKVTLS